MCSRSGVRERVSLVGQVPTRLGWRATATKAGDRQRKRRSLARLYGTSNYETKGRIVRLRVDKVPFVYDSREIWFDAPSSHATQAASVAVDHVLPATALHSPARASPPADHHDADIVHTLGLPTILQPSLSFKQNLG